MTVPGLQLGAPGVYRVPRREVPALRAERLDVAGFVGVAPRGPVDVPVGLDSWAEYRWLFGGFEGPGRLPFAVHAFFAQGGIRALVLRVSPLPRLPHPAALAAHARHQVTVAAPGAVPGRPAGAVVLDVLARDEGSWGRQLRLRWDFEAPQPFASTLRQAALDLPDGVRPPARSLLRLRGRPLPAAGVFAWTGPVRMRDDGPGRRVRCVDLDGLPASPPGPAAEPLAVEAAVVTVTVTVTDLEPSLRREERHADLGLAAGHPRFVGDELISRSRLVRPGAGWPEALLPPDPFLGSVESSEVGAGEDRWPAIGERSFSGDLPAQLLPVGGAEGLDEAGPVHGMDRMALEQELGLLAVPDLFWAFAGAQEQTEVSTPRPGPAFEDCRPVPPPVTFHRPPAPELLDARTQLEPILARQRRLVDLADRQRRFVALLDVPRFLPARAVARWRAAFDSSYAAAYHPWLGVVAPDDPTGLVEPVPPSAFAAGIIAERERRLGLPFGPANELAADAVTALEAVAAADHDALHLLGVDVFRPERDGFRLLSARTLSTDPDYRQLSVRRLVTMLRLAIERQLQWMVFEPNNPELRLVVTGVVTELLRELFRANAFAGATEAEAFFVRCDDALNPTYSQELGRVVAEIGVAPAQPLEYIVLRISQAADGGLGVEG
jgi:uncharacterized protein